MTSFAAAIEPAAQPRLAAAVFFVHFLAASSPWLARSAPPLAVALSMLAIAGFVATLARVPGRHCRLAAIALDGRGCRARLAGEHAFQPAELSGGARAYAALVSLEIVVGGRRLGWLLPRAALPAADFRRLKARIRLSC
ncbi:MAG: hypothetical protein ACRETI_06685 [Steroidobacteraceae bacterium]